MQSGGNRENSGQPGTINEFDKIQKALVETSERLHENGLRHKVQSGTICESALIKELRKSVPSLSFHGGVVKLGDKDARGSNLEGRDLSSQIDIIIHREKPLFEVEGYAVVHISDVVAVMEVKKWTRRSDLDSNGAFGKLTKINRDLSTKAGRGIPAYFVTFRSFDQEEWFTEVSKFAAIRAFCFFGTFSHKSGRNLYPWEESSWVDFKTPFKGQYQKLVHSIESLENSQ